MSLQRTTKIVISSRALLQYFGPFYGLVHWKITNLISLKEKNNIIFEDFVVVTVIRLISHEIISPGFLCLEFRHKMIFLLSFRIFVNSFVLLGKDFDLQVQWWIKLIGMSQGIQMEHPG